MNTMLTGKQLGAAIGSAIKLKLAKGTVKSKKEIAEHFNVKPPSIHDWINKGSISKDKIPMLIEYFSDVVGIEHWGLSPTGFFGGIVSPVAAVLGNIVPPDITTEISARITKVKDNTNDLYLKSTSTSMLIPQYDTGGSMGTGLILKEQPGVIEYIKVSQDWLSQNIGRYTSAKNLCLVTGFGDSMKPMYNPGDPVMVDIGVKNIDHDGVFFFRIENEGFIKRLQRIPGEGIVAMSENKAYRDWIIKPSMDFEVLGKVLKVWEGKDF